MGLKKRLELSVLSEDETKQIREGYLSNSMGEMKGAIRKLDLQVESTQKEEKKIEAAPRYEKTELADVAREVYRENINPKAEKAEFQDEGPDTHARRVEKRSIQRAIMGLRNGGDEGKISMVGPNGSGNVGKYSPSADMGSGNATNNYDNYYALTTDMTLEEYEAYINGKFGLEEAAPLIAMTAGKMAGLGVKGALTKGAGAATGLKGAATKAGINKASEMASAKVTDILSPNEEVDEDYIQDLKAELLQLEDSDWQSIDKVMRKIAKENYITPKQLHKEFKAQHGGQIPDEWLKENRDVEMCGFIPLNELAQLNPVGSIYEVTYAFRGGTQRQKFLFPSTEPPTKEQMEEIVRGFWPFARLLSFYPVRMDNEQNSNTMIAVPPVTENYKFYQESDWLTLSPEDEETYYKICEEEGEPLTAPEQQADGTYALLVSDHDTGEQKYITFGEGMSKDEWDEKVKAAAAANQKRDKERGMKIHSTDSMKDVQDRIKKRDTKKEEVYQELKDNGYILDEKDLHSWFNDSKSKDGKKGWVDVVTGKSCASDEPGEGIPKCVSSSKRASMSKSERAASKAKKRREDPGQQSKSGASKPTHVKTDVKEEQETVDEACWKGYEKKGMKTMFGKRYPNCVKKTKSEEVEYVDEGAWQRKEGKNPSGGLNEKGRKSYERENPGSDLKAPQPEGGPRKKSFCARMGGVKGPMKDEKGRPTRKALALRKWKC